MSLSDKFKTWRTYNPINFQIQDANSIFQVPPQQEKPTDLEKSIESMIQFQNDYIMSQNDSFNRLEVEMGHLVITLNGMRKNSLPTFLPFPIP